MEVEILIPAYTDHWIIDRVNYYYMYKLSLLGIRFYIENTMNHAKAMIIDTDEGLVGSQNLDYLSFDLNSEIGVFFHDTEVVSELLQIAQVWKDDAVLFDPTHYKPQWFDTLLSSFLNLFARNF